MRNRNTECPLAHRVFETIDIIFAVAYTRTILEEALIIGADVVIFLTVPAAKEGVTCICSSSGDRDAGIVVRADRVFSAVDDVVAFVGARTIRGDATLVVITDHVLHS